MDKEKCHFSFQLLVRGNKIQSRISFAFMMTIITIMILFSFIIIIVVVVVVIKMVLTTSNLFWKKRL